MSLLPLPQLSPSRTKLLRRFSLNSLKFHKSNHKLNPNLVKAISFSLVLLYFICHFVVIILASSTSSTPNPNRDSDDIDFCYDDVSCGPSTWVGKCNSGKRQSPINIPTAKVTSKAAVSTRIIVNRNYALPKLFFVRNTGQTLELAINADNKSKCFLRGDGLGKKPYYFSQLHFHWGPNNQIGSEHRISGKTYPLEMHMVHKQKNSNKVAVLAILFYLSLNDNANLGPILSLAGKVKEPGSQVRTTDSNKITLTKLLPRRMRMFRYVGSLTTPPCSESVIWTVFQDPVPVSAKQLAKFRRLLSKTNKPLTRNFRPVQQAFTSERKTILFVRQLKKSDEFQHYDYDHEDIDDMEDQHHNMIKQDNNHNHPGIFWGSGYGFGNHYHNTQQDWDYWHPDKFQPQSEPINSNDWTDLDSDLNSRVDEFELDFYHADHWIELASII